MRPYQLKRDILFYALQGKLVPQIAIEGTGFTLLEENSKRIKAYNPDIQKRIGKGCKPIQIEEIGFEIPPTWAWERFGNLVINFDSQRRPVTKSDRKTTKGLYDYYGATGAIDKVDEYLFDGEYLMIGEDGGNFFVDRDNSFIANGTFWANNHVHVVQPIVCNIAFLKICLDSYDLPNLGVINGIAVPKLNQENMNSIIIPIPPLAEQKRIVAKITELLPLIDRYEKAWSRLEDFNKRFPTEMQKSILQLAIQGKLVDQRPEEGTGEELYQQIQAERQRLIKEGKIKNEKPLPEITEDEIPFEIPENWKWVRIAGITTMNPKNELPDDLETSFIPMPCVSDGYRNEHTFESRNWGSIKKGFTHFANGDIGVAKITPCFQNRKSVIFKNLINGYGAGTTELSIVRVLGDLLIREYLLWFFKTEYFISNGVKSFTGTAGQQRIHKDYLAYCLIPLPPLAEQKRIVAKIEELLPLCNLLK